MIFWSTFGISPSARSSADPSWSSIHAPANPKVRDTSTFAPGAVHLRTPAMNVPWPAYSLIAPVRRKGFWLSSMMVTPFSSQGCPTAYVSNRPVSGTRTTTPCPPVPGMAGGYGSTDTDTGTGSSAGHMLTGQIDIRWLGVTIPGKIARRARSSFVSASPAGRGGPPSRFTTSVTVSPPNRTSWSSPTSAPKAGTPRPSTSSKSRCLPSFRTSTSCVRTSRQSFSKTWFGSRDGPDRSADHSSTMGPSGASRAASRTASNCDQNLASGPASGLVIAGASHVCRITGVGSRVHLT